MKFWVLQWKYDGSNIFYYEYYATEDIAKERKTILEQDPFVCASIYEETARTTPKQD